MIASSERFRHSQKIRARPAAASWLAARATGGKSDWRIRVGEYRVVYEIADAIRVVRVNRVRHRREVYR